jgi:hypothetical protein
MIQIARCETETGLQVLRLEVRHLLEDLFRRQSSREQIDDIADPDAHAAHTRAPTALLSIDGNSFGDLVHPVSITTAHYARARGPASREGALASSPAGPAASRRRTSRPSAFGDKHDVAQASHSAARRQRSLTLRHRPKRHPPHQKVQVMRPMNERGAETYRRPSESSLSVVK